MIGPMTTEFARSAIQLRFFAFDEPTTTVQGLFIVVCPSMRVAVKYHLRSCTAPAWAAQTQWRMSGSDAPYACNLAAHRRRTLCVAFARSDLKSPMLLPFVGSLISCRALESGADVELCPVTARWMQSFPLCTQYQSKCGVSIAQ